MGVYLLQNGSPKVNIIMLVIGLLCLMFAFGVIFLYRKKIIKEKKDRDNLTLKEVQTKYKIFYFWGHIAYILVIFTLLIGAIVFLSIFFGSI